MAQGEYVKVVLPYVLGDYNGDAEGVWVYLVQGTEDKGVGFVANDTIAPSAKWGDIVVFISSNPVMKAKVVDVLSYKIDGMNMDNLKSDDLSVAKKFYQSRLSLLEKEKKKMEIYRCPICGEPTVIWMTSDEEWNRVVPPELRKELLCKKCFNKLKRGK